MARFQSGAEIVDVEDRDEQLALLLAGWTRVRAANEAEFPDDPRDAAIEHALHENPDDDQTWLVYADRLLELGHPRGPLIALESAPAKNVVHRAEREAESHRLREGANEVLLGKLARRGMALRWRRGFIHEARLRGFAGGALEDVVFDLLRHPSGRFLRDLEIECHDRDHRLLIALLLHAANPPPLRRLAIRDREDSRIELGSLGAIGTTYPLLEDLIVEGNNTWDFDGIALPRATLLALHTHGMRRVTIEAIARASWSNLEQLELSIGDGSTCRLDDLAFMFALPKLEVLSLYDASFANELVAALVAAPIASKLYRLDLGSSVLDERTCELLVHARARFRDDFRISARPANVAALRDADLLNDRYW